MLLTRQTKIANEKRIVIMCLFFLVFEYCWSAWSFGFFIPATTANDLRLQRISIPDFIHYILGRASISLFECRVLNKGTTGTIFITSLV